MIRRLHQQVHQTHVPGAEQHFSWERRNSLGSGPRSMRRDSTSLTPSNTSLTQTQVYCEHRPLLHFAPQHRYHPLTLKFCPQRWQRAEAHSHAVVSEAAGCRVSGWSGTCGPGGRRPHPASTGPHRHCRCCRCSCHLQLHQETDQTRIDGLLRSCRPSDSLSV